MMHRALIVMLLMFTVAWAGGLPQFSIGHDHIEQLGVEDCDWSFVAEHLDVCQFQINALAYLSPFDELKRLVETLNAREIKISIECAYFDWTSNLDDFSAPNRKGIADVPLRELKPGIGRETALREIKKIVHLQNAGGKPDYIVMDGPIRRLIDPDGGPFGYAAPGVPLDQAVAEILDYMRAWLEAYPGLEFVCITNFPNWAWKDYPAYRPDRKGHGDWYPRIRQLVDAAKEAKLPLTAIRADNPYEYALGMTHVPWDAKAVDWLARINDLEAFAEGEGLEFQMTLNSSHGGMASAQGFYRETLKYLSEYRKRGGTPALYIVHTWYPFPEALCPEDEAYTLTNLLKAVMQDFQGEPGAPLMRELARPRNPAAHCVLDMQPPANENGNSHTDFPETGQWSYWTATGAESPIALGPEKAEYLPMAWNGKETLGRGYEGRSGSGNARITLDHVERIEMVPQIGRTPVLRWTSAIAGTVRVSGTWWMSAPGDMNLALFAEGSPLVERMDYTDTVNPGFAFDELVAVEPGNSLEFWADANHDTRHDAARLRVTIAPEEAPQQASN